jgi:flavin-dependent dehydrogenase
MTDVVIVGAGLAGLTAAIELSKRGYSVQVLEKKELPRHKVCGEYLSFEAVPYLLGEKVLDETIAQKRIRKLRIYTHSGGSVTRDLPLGGIGISRYRLDQALCERAINCGASVEFRKSVRHIVFENDHFTVNARGASARRCRVLINAAGKGQVLSRRKKIEYGKRYVGVKRYLDAPFEDDLVALFNFPGGYCGAAKVEDGSVDLAYMVDQELFRTYGELNAFEKQVLWANPGLGQLIDASRTNSEPFAISNFTLGRRSLVEEHQIMAGDSAGMIPPLSGNGMAMAIRSGFIAANVVNQFLSREIDRQVMENRYRSQWKNEFRNRLFWGIKFQRLMASGKASDLYLSLLKAIPGLLPSLVRLTHGKVWKNSGMI